MAIERKRQSIEIDWFLPTNGDGHHLTSSGLPKVGLFQQGERAPTLDYLRQVVRAAEQAAFDGIMVPTASGFEDPWLIVALMVQEVRRLQFILTLRPGVELPAYSAYKAATLQQLSDNRLALHLVSGSSRFEQRALGDFLEHDERYARSAEFLDVFRATWAGREHHGRHYRTGSPAPIADEAMLPPICFGGASAVAERIAASHAQTYLMWGEPPAMIHERIQRMRELAAAAGRELRFGLRLHVFAAADSRQAWRHVGRLLEEIPRDAIERATPTGGLRVGRTVAADQPDPGARARSARPGSLAESLGRCRPGARRRGYGTGGQLRGGRRTHRGVSPVGRGHLHPVRLPASGRSHTPGRGAVAVAASRSGRGRRTQAAPRLIRP
ncbi:LLM class flavin-dependent oxidoreductase [Pseudomonas aeruginosa]|uniref:LLM class flavin-dependent oxidoreductase n=1 Tax=Pseudomonas aeruginosa TaxID=287 RepID=UPI003D3355A1